MLGLRTAFTFSLLHRTVPKCAQAGVLDDSARLRLVVGTVTNKVVIHETETVLNINERIIALTVAPLGTSYDLIFVGTTSSVLAYDVQKNTNLFRKDIADGVSCIQVGSFSTHGTLALCGSNCAIWGLDASGKDSFWTVTGDNVLSLCLCDIDSDGINELVAGSEDFDIRVFKDDLLLFELSETDAVTSVYDLGHGRFAYALANGTLGAYQGEIRLWRIKSKNQVAALVMFPDSETLTCAWSGGKIDMRDAENGEVKLKETLNGHVANAFMRNSQLTVVMLDGSVHGFEMSEDQPIADDGQSVLHDLGLKKHSLLVELKNYELNRQGASVEILENERKLPANTHLETCLIVNSDMVPPSVELQLSVSNDAIIRAVIVFAEGIFPGESFITHPTSDFSSNLSVQLRPDKDIAVDLHIKTFIGYPESTQLHVFELTRALPRFSMFALCNDTAPEPEGNAVFTINERPPRLATWINENFLLCDEIGCEEDSSLSVRFYSMRSTGMLFIEMDNSGKVTVRNDDMELVGNVIQAIAEYFHITAISTIANFPAQIKALNELTEKLNEMFSLRDQLSAAMAERLNSVKEMLVRAEDARIIRQMQMMRKYYLKLQNLNQALVAEHSVRCNNHEQLLRTLRELNKTIEKGARLRVGDPASKVIAACRSAIAEENFEMLPKIILFGV